MPRITVVHLEESLGAFSDLLDKFSLQHRKLENSDAAGAGECALAYASLTELLGHVGTDVDELLTRSRVLLHPST